MRLSFCAALALLFVACAGQAAEIRVHNWIDLNLDGVRQETEPPIAILGVLQVYDLNHTSLYFNFVKGSGIWSVQGLNPGTYVVEFRFEDPEPNQHLAFTARDVGNDENLDSDIDPISGLSAQITVAADTVAHVGLGILDPTASVSGRVWVDANANGIREPEETGIPTSMSVTLDPIDGGTYGVNVPVKSDGTWNSGFLWAGTYRVQVNVPLGVYGFSPPNVGDDLYDSDVVHDGDFYSDNAACTVSVRGKGTVVDAGVFDATGSITGRVWLDTDRDGIRDPVETSGVPGPVVTIESIDFDFGRPTVQPLIHADGTWNSGNLLAGKYLVRVTIPDEVYDFTLSYHFSI